MKNKMKYLFFFIIFSSLLILNTVCLAVTPGKVTASSIKVREEGSTSGKVLFNLSKNEVVNVLDEKDGWYKVLYNNEKEGWASKEYISTESTEYDITASKDIEIKSFPSLNTESVASIAKNKKVTLVDNIGSWLYVKNEEISGWTREENVTGILKDPEVKETSEETEVAPEEETKPEEVKPEENVSEPKEEDKKEEKKEEVKEETTEKVTIIKYVYVNSSSVRVRKEASTASEVIETTTQGNKIPVVGEDGDWYKIKIMDKIGYIRKDLVSDKLEENSRSESNARSETVNVYTGNEAQKTQETAPAPVEPAAPAPAPVEEPSPAPSSSSSVVEFAKGYLGCKYVYGGSSSKGFDCSGFTMFVFSNFGKSFPHSASAQSAYGTPVSKDNLQSGDLVFFSQDYSGSNIGHVGIYVGDGQFIHSCCPQHGVRYDSLSSSYYKSNYVTARRISL